MHELLLAALTCAASAAAGVVLARGKPRALTGGVSVEDALRALSVTIALALAGVIASAPHVSPARALSLASSALLGALCGLGAPRAAPQGKDVTTAASAIIIEQGIALLGLIAALFVGALASGALRDPQVLAPALPALAIGFAAGAQVGRSERVARVAAETAIAMIPLAMLFERNALLLRAGPIATSAIGLFALPIGVRALGLVALGASTTARARAGYVFASLMAIAVLGAAFVMAGVFWPSALFCGVAGVAAALFVWRAGSLGGTAIAAFAAIAGSLLASVVVAERTGLAHPSLLAVTLVVVALSACAEALEALEPDDRGFTRRAATLALAPLAAIAVSSVGTSAACARWASSEMLPSADAAVVLAKCESAKIAAQHVDLLHPSVALGAGAGALLAWETREDDSVITGPLRVAVVLAIGVGLRLGFGTGAPAMAALCAAALVVAMTSSVRQRTAHALTALAIALAPLYA